VTLALLNPLPAKRTPVERQGGCDGPMQHRFTTSTLGPSGMAGSLTVRTAKNAA
jgi:hypothetical protein